MNVVSTAVFKIFEWTDNLTYIQTYIHTDIHTDYAGRRTDTYPNSFYRYSIVAKNRSRQMKIKAASSVDGAQACRPHKCRNGEKVKDHLKV